jgi:transposase-like protein
MAKHPKPEEIVAKLRQADVLISQGQSAADAIRALGVSSVTYYRWRREFGGLKSDQVRRMKDLETENQRLRKAIADLTLEPHRVSRRPFGLGQAAKAWTSACA